MGTPIESNHKVNNTSIALLNLGIERKKVEEIREYCKMGFKIDYPEFPTQLASLSSILKRMGYEVKCLDLAITTWLGKGSKSIKDFIPFLESFSPEFVFIYQKDNTLHGIRYLISVLKQLRKSRITRKCVVISPNLTKEVASSILSKLKVHVPIIFGEIEPAFASLSSNLSIEKLKECPNTAYCNGKEVKTNSIKYTTENDLNDMPLPDFRSLEIEEYLRIKNYIPINLSRGCHFNCKHCPTSKIQGRTWRGVKIGKAYELLMREKDLNNVKLSITDYDFCYNLEWFKAICEIFGKLRIPWECRLRADLIDDKIVNDLAIGGCERVILGADVLYEYNPSLAKSIGKLITLNDLKKACSICRRNGIDITLYFIPEFYPNKKSILDIIEQCGVNSIILSSFRDYNVLNSNTSIISPTLKEIIQDIKDKKIEVTICTGLGEGAW